MHEEKSILDNWNLLRTWFEERLSKTEKDKFADIVFILITWVEVNIINMESFRLINRPVAKIMTVHTSGNEAKKATSDVAKGFKG